MIVAGSASPLLLSSAGGYNLTNSLRFRNSASAYLSRTPASTGSLTTFTFSTWVKRGRLDIDGYLFSAVKTSPTATDAIRFNSNGSFAVFYEGSGTVHVRTSSVYRDPSAWYHVVVQIDSTQATASNRIKIYINGSQVTSLDITNYPAQNATFPAWNRTVLHTIGNDAQLALYADQYLAEVNFIDGQALTPSSFGETSTSTGVWQPKKYTGTYGTNGFYLPFTDNSALTTSSNVGLGKDFSGNGNYLATNNISITAGTTYDSMTDVPTLTSATTANYAVWNPLALQSSMSITNGNLTTQNTGTVARTTIGSIGVSSGKWYWELTAFGVTGLYAGICQTQPAAGDYIGVNTTSWAYANNGQKINNSSFTSYGSSWTTNDVIGVALDMDAGTITFYKNNTSQGQAFSGITGTVFPAMSPNGVSGNGFNANFGQQPFAYTPPTGFNRLNTFNLPTPTIGATASTTANKYMDATTYSGNGGTQSITSLGFQPDLVWVKRRNAVASHNLVDAVRGASKILYSDATTAEITDTNDINAFNSNGWTMGLNTDVNASGGTYVGWTWRGANATVSNTAGSITSTVSANTSAGFSIVTYTGNGTGGATVGHGLGVAPSMVIVKKRSGVADWPVQHISLGPNASLRLNGTNATANEPWWNSTAPSSTVFTLGNSNTINQSGETFVAYCFAQVAGYSAFGSYTGNGSNDGPFIYLGFRPRFVMIKRTDSTGNWIMFDSARGTYNVNGPYLYANSSTTEGTSTSIGLDFLSNGFKNINTYNDSNTSSATYIYMAFAENPFKYSNAR